MNNKEAIDYMNTLQAKCENGYEAEAINLAINLAINALEEKLTGEWIPVSERLPHAEYGESDTVLVSACWKSDKDLKDKAIFVTEAYFDGSCFRRPTGEVYWNIKVIAWQPLPEPYKEAENE